jgi:hypothetical protein
MALNRPAGATALTVWRWASDHFENLAARRLGTSIGPGGIGPVDEARRPDRHRLSRGGDRAANNAVYRIAVVRKSAHPQIREYVQRQAANGRTKKGILGCSNEPIIREIFRLLTRPTPIDDYRDLRPARQAKNLTPATVATHFDVPLNHLPARTRPATQRHPSQRLPPMAHRRLTPYQQ